MQSAEPLFGFVFAFYTFSRLRRVSMMERMVHMATGSDAIHVAIVPATMMMNNNNNNMIHVDRVAYTSFMDRGVEVQPVAQVLNDCYTFYFMPVRDSDAFQVGLKFLNGLLGAQYNNLSLFTTLLPRRMRRAGAIPSWVSCENKRLMPRADKPAVFCSQMGLMLCYAVDAVPPIINLDPAACSPGDLLKILRRRQPPHCLQCPLSLLQLY